MNVGIVSTWFERGAAYVSRAYLEVLSRDHNVFVYARGGERYATDDPNWDGDFVTWGKRCATNILTYVDWPDFKKWILDNRLDVVIFNEQTSWESVVRTKRLGIPIGAYVDYYNPETVDFFAIYDFLFCNTKRHYSVFKGHPNAVYIPWGTDIELFSPTPATGKSNTLVFFHSCGMNAIRKGTDLLLRAFQMVEGDAALLIHSQRPLTEYPHIDQTILLNPRIQVVVGDVHAPGLYCRGDVYVYPTQLEGIGLTIAEALASGLPVITTDCPPMNEFVVSGLNGRLVTVESSEVRADHYFWPITKCDVGSLRSAMQFYVDNANCLEAYRSAARIYAQQHLDWKKNSAAVLDMILDCKKVRSPYDNRLIDRIIAHELSRGAYPSPLYLKVRQVLSRARARMRRSVCVLVEQSKRMKSDER